MKTLWNILVKVSNSKPLSIYEKENIKKCLDSSWEEFNKKNQEEIQKETIALANNYGFINSNYTECSIFLKNMYKSY